MSNNILTVGELSDRLNKLPRDMRVCAGAINGRGIDLCCLISGVSADPKGNVEMDDCIILIDPKAPYSNLKKE